ncbi:MAG TPA: peptidylprolyl isomerase [Terrimicrobiaceae bacterium]|nr:peptidylprolyl isomerase [Terrimicrobiaceae bacterium]
MKTTLAAFGLLFAMLAGVSAATIGPEVAVMQIQIGREKQFQQVVLGLYDTAAPLTVANFKELCRKKFYNGMRFHRVFPSTLVQTGDPKSRHGSADLSGTGGPGFTVPAELGGRLVRGSVATARLPDAINPTKASNGSQFFMCLAPLPKLDGKNTVFGEVLEGMDVLDAISNQQTDSNDFPLAKIVIKSITIQPRFAEAATP